LIDKDRDVELNNYGDGVFQKMPNSGEDLRFQNHWGDWNVGVVSVIKYVTAKDLIKIYLETVEELEPDV